MDYAVSFSLRTLCLDPKDFLLFFSESFTVLFIIFKRIIYFELIFTCNVKLKSKLILLPLSPIALPGVSIYRLLFFIQFEIFPVVGIMSNLQLKSEHFGYHIMRFDIVFKFSILAGFS